MVQAAEKYPAKKLICRTNNMNRLKRIILKIKTTLPTNNPKKTKSKKKTFEKRVLKTRALCALYYCDKKIREKNTMFKQKPALHFNAKIKNHKFQH